MKFDVRNFALSSGVAATAMFVVSRFVHLVLHYSGLITRPQVSRGMMMFYKSKPATFEWAAFMPNLLVGIVLVFLFSCLGGWIFAWTYNKLESR